VHLYALITNVIFHTLKSHQLIYCCVEYCQLYAHESNTFLFEKYAIQTNGTDKPPKPPLPFRARGLLSNTPIPRPTPPSPPQTASRSNQPFCHNTLSGHRHTHRPTHGIGDWSISRALTLCYIDNERRANKFPR